MNNSTFEDSTFECLIPDPGPKTSLQRSGMFAGKNATVHEATCRLDAGARIVSCRHIYSDQIVDLVSARGDSDRVRACRITSYRTATGRLRYSHKPESLTARNTTAVAHIASLIVDAIFVRVGKNPHRSLWDDGIAIVLVVPVLALVFHNGFLSILTDIVAGLSGGLCIKWMARSSNATSAAT